MGSSFFGFNIARSGLFASQRALSVTAHNIANANTPGYSRQRLDTVASRPDTLPAAQGTIGTGVDPVPIKQIRDAFLDFKYRGEKSVSGEWSKKEDVLKTIETVFNEPSESGIRTVMDEFFSAVQELNKTPESLTTRALVRQRGIALAANLNHMSDTLKKMQSDLDFELEAVVSEVNGYARQIVDLNKAIYLTELDGSKANDMRDQRNLLLDKISERVAIDYFEDSNGRFFVNVQGHNLVSHYEYDTLMLTERTAKLNEDDSLKLQDISWTSGSTFDTTGGTVKAILDMRDNISGMEKGIPYYVDKLNEFADTIISELNKIQVEGYDLDGNKGVPLFTIDNMTASDYEAQLMATGLDNGPAIDVTSDVLSGVTASSTAEEKNTLIRNNIDAIIKNNPAFSAKSIKMLSDGRWYVTDRIKASEITISKDIENDLDKIAASSTKEGVPGNGENALKMADIRHNVELFAWGSPDDFVKSLVSNLGVDAKEAERITLNQESLLGQVETSRQSIMGVSLDEEMAEMLKFQHAYNASARMLTTLDGILDTVINRLGLVGR